MNRFESLVSSFEKASIGVIGDVAADIYILGHPERLSREAPVMVVRFEEERLIPGCAANTANNLLSLGCRVWPVTVMGDDDYGRRIRSLFRDRLSLEGVIESPGFKTVAKTRILVGDANRTKQQVIRIDKELQEAAPPGLEERVLQAIDTVDSKVDAWLVSDYHYFVITPRVAERVVALSREKPLVVDSRFRSLWFRGARCFTPNESEAIELSGTKPRSDQDVVDLGRKVLKELKAQSLIVTRGNRGMLVFDEGGGVHVVPTVGSDEVVDVSGAGDTVAATVTAALVSGADTLEAARLASCAASVVVMKTGAATCSPKELVARLPLLGGL